MLRQLDLADAATDPAERRARATVVVVGAGYTGTEAAAQLRRMVRLALPRFPRLRASEVRFLLVERAGQVLPELGPWLGRRAAVALSRIGVETRPGVAITEVTADAVRLSDGDTVAAHTMVWAAGVVADPIVAELGLPLRDGRLAVDEMLRVHGPRPGPPAGRRLTPGGSAERHPGPGCRSRLPLPVLAAGCAAQPVRSLAGCAGRVTEW